MSCAERRCGKEEEERSRVDQARAEEGVQCQRCRLQSDSSLQSTRRGALAQMHETGLTGLPQHCTRERERETVTGYYHVDH